MFAQLSAQPISILGGICSETFSRHHLREQCPQSAEQADRERERGLFPHPTMLKDNPGKKVPTQLGGHTPFPLQTLAGGIAVGGEGWGVLQYCRSCMEKSLPLSPAESPLWMHKHTYKPPCV